MASRDRPHWDVVTIIGVGLIGGSVGMALRERGLAKRVIGVGRRPESLQKAIKLGAIDGAAESLEAGAAESNWIIVCTPVDRIVADVRLAAAVSRPGTLITDAGSTKVEIVSKLDRVKFPAGVHFVGGHPIAGGEQGGVENAKADLYDGRVCVVTPGKKTSTADADAVSDFWSGLGMTVLRMSPADHDKALAATSHLPHLIAAALAGASRPEELPLRGSGWRDTTRIAAGDPQLWRGIFLANQAHTLRALKRFEKTLSAMRAALERGDAKRLEKLLMEAKQNRDAVGS